MSGEGEGEKCIRMRRRKNIVCVCVCVCVRSEERQPKRRLEERSGVEEEGRGVEME